MYYLIARHHFGFLSKQPPKMSHVKSLQIPAWRTLKITIRNDILITESHICITGVIYLLKDCLIFTVYAPENVLVAYSFRNIHMCKTHKHLWKFQGLNVMFHREKKNIHLATSLYFKTFLKKRKELWNYSWTVFTCMWMLKRCLTFEVCLNTCILIWPLDIISATFYNRKHAWMCTNYPCWVCSFLFSSLMFEFCLLYLR